MPRLDRWLWHGTGVGSRVARVALLPAAVTFRAASRLRSAAYDGGLLRSHRLPGPTISVGNLSVGGTGKTPVTGWIAHYCSARGHRPAVLLRGYGRDEAPVHRLATPEAIVVEHPDRRIAAARAAREGATVFLLDDGFQRRDVARDLDLVLWSADADRPGWPLPAGPWREGRNALARASLVVITRKAAEPGDARRAAAGRPYAIARLDLATLAGLRTGSPLPMAALRGRSVVASAGVGDPRSFAAQLRALGATVRRLDWPDHHRYRPRDLARIRAAGAGADHVIVTTKDALKLRPLWPREWAEPEVASLEVTWETGATTLTAALDRVLGTSPAAPRTGRHLTYRDAAPPACVVWTTP